MLLLERNESKVKYFYPIILNIGNVSNVLIELNFFNKVLLNRQYSTISLVRKKKC